MGIRTVYTGSKDAPMATNKHSLLPEMPDSPSEMSIYFKLIPDAVLKSLSVQWSNRRVHEYMTESKTVRVY